MIPNTPPPPYFVASAGNGNRGSRYKETKGRRYDISLSNFPGIEVFSIASTSSDAPPTFLCLVVAGINTVEALAFSSKRELCEIKGMSDAKVAKLKEAGTRSFMPHFNTPFHARFFLVCLQQVTHSLDFFPCLTFFCSCKMRSHWLYYRTSSSSATRRNHQAEYRLLKPRRNPGRGT